MSNEILKLVDNAMGVAVVPVTVVHPLAKIEHKIEQSNHAAMLMAQAKTLDTIFASLVSRASEARHLEQVEGYMRVALKVQSQCVRTVQVLSSLGKPGHVSFVQATFSPPARALDDQ